MKTPKTHNQKVSAPCSAKAMQDKPETRMREEFRRIIHREMMSDGTFTSDGWKQIREAIAKFNQESEAAQ